MSFTVDLPIRTFEQAVEAKKFIGQCPDGEERDDRLIEIAALCLERLWKQFGAAENYPVGRSVKLILDSKRMFAVNLSMNRPSRPRQVDDLEHDRLITWHQDVFYALLTSEHIMGSMRNADLFRAAMLDRFSENGTPASVPHEYKCVKLGSTDKPLLEHLSTPGHNARIAAAELRRNTPITRSPKVKSRI